MLTLFALGLVISDSASAHPVWLQRYQWYRNQAWQAVSEVSNNDCDLDPDSGHQVYFYYFFDVYTLEYSEGFSEKNTSEEV